MIKKMLRKKIVVPEKLSIADDLHKEHSSNTIFSQKEDSKHEPPEESDQLGAIIKLKRKLTEDITQQNTEVSVIMIGFFLGVIILQGKPTFFDYKLN